MEKNYFTYATMPKEVAAIVKKHRRLIGLRLLNRANNEEFSREDIRVCVDAEVAERNKARAENMAAEKARYEKIAQDEAAYRATPAFREEVIKEIIADGATRLQAEGRTRDQARLYSEAVFFNLI